MIVNNVFKSNEEYDNLIQFCYYYLRNITFIKPNNIRYGYNMCKYLDKSYKLEKCLIFTNIAIINYKDKLVYNSLYTNN